VPKNKINRFATEKIKGDLKNTEYRTHAKLLCCNSSLKTQSSGNANHSVHFTLLTVLFVHYREIHNRKKREEA